MFFKIYKIIVQYQDDTEIPTKVLCEIFAGNFQGFPGSLKEPNKILSGRFSIKKKKEIEENIQLNESLLVTGEQI